MLALHNTDNWHETEFTGPESDPSKKKKIQSYYDEPITSTLTIQSRLRVSYRVVMIQVDASACTICFVSRYVMGGWCTELVYTTSESKFSCNNSSCFSFPQIFCSTNRKADDAQTMQKGSQRLASQNTDDQFNHSSRQTGRIPVVSSLCTTRYSPHTLLPHCSAKSWSQDFTTLLLLFFRFSSSISMP